MDVELVHYILLFSLVHCIPQVAQWLLSFLQVTLSTSCSKFHFEHNRLIQTCQLSKVTQIFRDIFIMQKDWRPTISSELTRWRRNPLTNSLRNRRKWKSQEKVCICGVKCRTTLKSMHSMDLIREVLVILSKYQFWSASHVFRKTKITTNELVKWPFCYDTKVYIHILLFINHNLIVGENFTLYEKRVTYLCDP